MRFRLLTLALALLIEGLHSNEAADCYSSTTDIDLEELSLIQEANYDSSMLSPRTYVLCPDTVIPIGTGDSFDDWQGEFPLVIVNPNIHILCGESGSSENKCTLFGGEAQVQGLGSSDLPDSNIVPNASNFTIQGVTFKSALGTSVNFEIHGENIVIQDCLFLVSPRGCVGSCPVSSSVYLTRIFNPIGELW